MVAYRKAKELGGVVAGPKALGAFGASYIYPIFISLGIIEIDTAANNNYNG